MVSDLTVGALNNKGVEFLKSQSQTTNLVDLRFLGAQGFFQGYFVGTGVSSALGNKLQKYDQNILKTSEWLPLFLELPKDVKLHD